MGISTAIDAGALARVVGIKTAFTDLRGSNAPLLPQAIGVLAQGATAATYPLTKTRIFAAREAGDLYGYGSPAHLAAEKLLPTNGDGVGTIPVTIYPLEDAPGAVAQILTITPAGTVTTASTAYVVQGGVRSVSFGLTVGDNVAAVTAKITAAVAATLASPTNAVDNTTDVSLTTKWAGASAADLVVTIEGAESSGMTFAVADAQAGTGDPVLAGALAQVGDIWQTMLLNCLPYNNTAALDELSTFGEGRWGSLTHKPCVAFCGSVDDQPTIAAITDARKTDRTNSVLPFPGSPALPFVAAARALARIAPIANNRPAWDYPRHIVDTIVPGLDSAQWLYNQRDAAVKAGTSVTVVRDAVIQTSDTITMYHPTGEEPAAFRYVKDIVKLQNVIFNIALAFESPEWDGAPLLPDSDPAANSAIGAKRPRMAVARVYALIDGLAAEGILSSIAETKASVVAEIDPNDPNRLNIRLTVRLAGNANKIAVDLNFGFTFGG
jgi:phage tail sheath gpL-like